MPVTLDAADRRLLGMIGGTLLLVFGLTLWLAPGGYANEGYPSTWSDASDGGRAALLTLRAAGYHVEQWQQPPSALPLQAQHEVLILAKPFRPAGTNDRDALRLWLARGGTILAIGGVAARLLPQGGVAPSQGPLQRLDWHAVPAVLPGRLTQDAPEIHTPSIYVWRAGHPGAVALYADQGSAVVVWYRYGAGNVIWWADPTPLSNAGLSQPGNLELLLNSLSIAGSRQQVHVYWDEYFHTLPAGFWPTLAIAPLLGGLAQLGLIFLFVLWTFSRRRTPVWQPAAAARLAPMEYVDTMAALYRRTRAAGVAVEVALERFRFRLSRRLGIDSRAPAGDLAQAAARQLRQDAAELTGLMEQCRQALSGTSRPETALTMVQKLHDQMTRIEQLRREHDFQGE